MVKRPKKYSKAKAATVARRWRRNRALGFKWPCYFCGRKTDSPGVVRLKSARTWEDGRGRPVAKKCCLSCFAKIEALLKEFKATVPSGRGLPPEEFRALPTTTEEIEADA